MSGINCVWNYIRRRPMMMYFTGGAVSMGINEGT
jgi:hypothetical protein